MRILNTKIDTKSFFRKGVKPLNEEFGVFLVCGYMGSGKTYQTIYEVENNFTSRKVKTNILSYHSNKHEIEGCGIIREMVQDYSSHKIFIIDEMNKIFPKDSKIDKDFYNWLQHSRKCSRYVFMIYQEYINVPTWLRGVANRVYTTRKYPFGILKTDLGIPYLDDQKEWQVDTISSKIYKRNKCITDLYDTLEVIK